MKGVSWEYRKLYSETGSIYRCNETTNILLFSFLVCSLPTRELIMEGRDYHNLHVLFVSI
jgi:hypothetical protein